MQRSKFLSIAYFVFIHHYYTLLHTYVYARLFKELTAMLFPYGLAFLPTGPEWRHRRDMVGPLFTWGQLKSFLPQFEDATKQLMKFKWCVQDS